MVFLWEIEVGVFSESQITVSLSLSPLHCMVFMWEMGGRGVFPESQITKGGGGPLHTAHQDATCYCCICIFWYFFSPFGFWQFSSSSFQFVAADWSFAWHRDDLSLSLLLIYFQSCSFPFLSILSWRFQNRHRIIVIIIIRRRRRRRNHYSYFLLL